MKKIENKEEFLKTRFDHNNDCFNTDYPFDNYSYPHNCENIETLQKFLKESKITLIPSDDIRDGLFGFVLCKDETEQFWYISRKTFHESTQNVKHDTFASFKDAFNSAVEKDHYIMNCDDPKRLMIGFMVVCNSGSILHEIRLNTLKQIE